jgi:hypothetical protein
MGFFFGMEEVVCWFIFLFCTSILYLQIKI